MASERIMPRQLRSGRGKQRNHTRCNSRYLNSNKDAAAEEWGPSGSQASLEGPGNQNLRTALLTNNEPANRDRRKGRLPSLEDHEVATREPDSEEVLVYVHKVQPTDTLAGVLLAYDIEPGALRKANRLWPNDSIQMRSQLYLPVGDCAVKGTPLLTDGLEEQFTKPREINSGNNSQQQANTFPNGHGGVQVTNLKVSHGHHSFIQIDPIGPVEIVRLARPKLSHFPSPSGDRPQPKPRIQDHSPPVELQYKKHSPDISTDTFERLEVVGAAIETFVRRVAASARTNWVNKTTNDLIELTSQIGRLPQSAGSKEPSTGNGRNTNSHRREEATSASSATSNGPTVLSDTTPEAPRSRRRTRRADPSEG